MVGITEYAVADIFDYIKMVFKILYLFITYSMPVKLKLFGVIFH